VQQVAGSGGSTGLLIRDSFQTIVVSPTQAQGASTTVDDMETGVSAGVAQSVTAAPGATDQSGATLAGVLGGERDLFISNDVTSGVGADISMVVDGSDSNLLQFSIADGATGTLYAIYDGSADTAPADKGTVDPNGLGGIDLTEGGTRTAFQFLARTDTNLGPVSLVVTIFDGTNQSSVSTAIPVNVATQEMIVDFSSFTGVDLTNVGAIRLSIDTAVSADGAIEFAGTIGPTEISENLANLNPMSLGDRVFADLNNNGILDNGETGIANVVLQLFLDEDGDGVLDVGEGPVLDGSNAPITATTDATGNYLFSDLLPNSPTQGDPLVLESYIVVIANNQTALASLTSSTGNDVSGVAPDPNNDVNSDDNGTLSGSNTVSGGIRLVAGSEPNNDGDTNVNTNLTLDFGFTPQVDVEIDKSGTATIDAGGNITYTLTITNNSTIAATNIVVSDDLPAGVTFLPNGQNGSTSSSAWVVQSSGPELQATIASLAAGASQTLTVVVSTDPAAPVGTLNNVATVTSDGIDTVPANNEDDADTTVTRNAVLTLTKSDGSRTSVSPGDEFTYVLTVTNTGLSTANNVTLTDLLPVGYTFVEFGTGSQGNPQVADVGGRDQITAGVASLAVGATMVVNIVVSVDSDITGSNIVNTAETDSDDSAAVTASDTNTIVDNRFDLLITKDDTLTSVTTGQLVTYTITVDNDGPGTANNVVIADALPAGLEFVSATSNSANIGTINGQNYSATIATLASGETRTISLVARVRSSASGANLANTATVTADSASTLEIGTRANTATDTDTLVREVTLNIQKSDSADPVAAGATFAYTVIVFNSGSADAPDVLVSDPLPAGLTFVDGSFIVNGGGTGAVTFNSSTNRLEANLGTLLAGGSSTVNQATVTINVRSAPTATGTVTNTATATSPDNTTGVSDSETTALNTSFDLTISKDDGVTEIATGSNLVYRIIVTNNGPSQASNVTITDPLPASLTFVSVTSSTGSFTNNNGTISGTLTSLAPGAAVTVTVTARVNNDAPEGSTISNTASVSVPANTGESNTGNNSATSTALVSSFGTIAGATYIDANRNGVRDGADRALSGVTIRLTGTETGSTTPITREVVTDANGAFIFSNLRPGTYSVQEVQPDGFIDGTDSAGNSGGALTNDLISNIALTTGEAVTGISMGEIQPFSKRAYLT
jgi:uncharacterized repeat protein (TIGR01451 family)